MRRNSGVTLRWVAGAAAALLLAVACAPARPPATADDPDDEVFGPLTPQPPLPATAAEKPSPAGKPATSAPAAGEAAAAAGDGSAAPPAGEASAGGAKAAAPERLRQELIVVESGAGSPPPTPGELAASLRAQRAATADDRPAPPTRITNDNLGEYARRGQLTTASPQPAATTEEEAAAGAAADAELGEAYWRERVRGVRQGWHDVAAEVERLEKAAAELRWRFYATDDPGLRDGRIKPEWDRTLDRLERARQELADYPDTLAAVLDEGRRAGALPGWLREGLELEPAPAEDAPAEDPAAPIEPPVAPEPTDGGATR